MRRTGVGTLVVVDDERRLLGLLTARDLRFVDDAGTVAERMTPRDRLVVREGRDRQRRPPKRSMRDAQDQEAAARRRATARLIGLVTADGSAEAGAAAVRDARRSRPPARRRRDRRQGRLPRARRGAAARRRRRHRHRHRPRALGGDGPRHRGVPQAVRRHRADRRQRRHRRRRRAS